MSLLGLRLVHTGTAEPIGVRAAVVRTFVVAVATASFGVGLAVLAWTALTDPGGLRRGWHDHLVSSVVVDGRPAPAAEEPPGPRPAGVVNLSTLRLTPAARQPQPASPARPRPGRVGRPQEPAAWDLAFDTGQRVPVDTLVLVGREPVPRAGEQGARLVALGPAATSVAPTHLHLVVAADGALVVTDRGSAAGSTLVRSGMPTPLVPGRARTLLEGDVVRLGDRTLVVERRSRRSEETDDRVVRRPVARGDEHERC
jgi:hypothetical protein